MPSDSGSPALRQPARGERDGTHRAQRLPVEERLEGQPAQIKFTVSAPEITVKGSGGTEASTITIQVLDVNGNSIQDVANNLEVVITDGPGGGESLNGNKTVGQVLTLATQGGKAVWCSIKAVNADDYEVRFDKPLKLDAKPLEIRIGSK